MFDARDTNRKTSAGLGFGILVVALMGILFMGALYFPSLTGEGKRIVPAGTTDAAGNILLDTFRDEPTRAYLRKLDETLPSAAQDLERQVRRATSRGADKVELGLLVLQAGSEGIASNLERLARADTRHFNAMLELSETALRDLSRSGAPYCKGSDLMTFASLPDQQLYAAVFDRVGHGAGLYDFGLAFNSLALEALEDARRNPVTHGRITRSDEQALQGLAFAIMSNPDLMKLLTTEGKSRTEMDKVVASVNFCDMGAKMITQVEALPEATKGRLWAEMLSQAASGQAERTLRQLTY